jgi:hypothetical protein
MTPPPVLTNAQECIMDQSQGGVVCKKENPWFTGIY